MKSSVETGLRNDFIALQRKALGPHFSDPAPDARAYASLTLHAAKASIPVYGDILFWDAMSISAKMMPDLKELYYGLFGLETIVKYSALAIYMHSLLK